MENPPKLEGRNMYMYLVVKPGFEGDGKTKPEDAAQTEEENA